ncbi:MULTISPECIES: hypothetical protein [Sulfurimonas]|uniref:hypothetical protein n=1 Tax=Sulfurimonas TaxID=202746 RepID=UPI00125F27E4|nr:hypothetical protein [Sulfurimonas hydrogeniphila]
MQILCTDLFEKQLQDILQKFAKEDFMATKNFKMYLDTVIINIPTKAQKYKQSVYFNDENIKDLEHQGFIIPFFIDKASETYLVLGIVEK